MNETSGEGADKGCECVGYQAHDHEGNEDPALTMNTLVQSVRFTGSIGIVGVFLPADPDEMAKEGKIAFDYGLSWFKGQKIGSGQCPVKRYNRKLAELIHQDKAKPSFIISHELGLDDAPDAYNREKGWTKVVLHPDKAA